MICFEFFNCREGERGWIKLKIENCTCNCMKPWKPYFTYARMVVGRSVPVTKCWKEAKLLAYSQLAKGLRLWSVTSRLVRLGFLVDVYNASACGSSLNCIPACVMTLSFARFLFVGKHEILNYSSRFVYAIQYKELLQQ